MSLPVKSLDQPPQSISFLYFYFFYYSLHCRLNSEDINTVKENIWKYVVNKKGGSPKVLYFIVIILLFYSMVLFSNI